MTVRCSFHVLNAFDCLLNFLKFNLRKAMKRRRGFCRETGVMKYYMTLRMEMAVNSPSGNLLHLQPISLN